MRILIAGGAGFIGTNFTRQAVNRPDVELVVVIDSLTYAGRSDNVDEISRFFQVDIGDSELVLRIINDQKIDTIVNFAAESHVDRSLVDVSPFLETNILGTIKLLEAAIHASIPRFLHVSTDEVYGSLIDEFASESFPLNPGNPYSASKAAADSFVLAYANTYNLPAVITRCCNNYGPYQIPEKLVPLFISKALANESMPLYGSGTNVREWIHVNDHCRAIWHVLNMIPFPKGQVFNIGTGVQVSNRDMAEIICELSGASKRLITTVVDRKGHDFRYALDSRKLRKTGWFPIISLDYGMEQTIQWYKLNHGRYS